MLVCHCMFKSRNKKVQFLHVSLFLKHSLLPVFLSLILNGPITMALICNLFKKTAILVLCWIILLNLKVIRPSERIYLKFLSCSVLGYTKSSYYYPFIHYNASNTFIEKQQNASGPKFHIKINTLKTKINLNYT